MRSASPTIASAASTCSRRSARRQPGQQQRQLDVLERGQHRHQVVELENETDVARAPVGELGFVSAVMSMPPTAASPLSGLSMPAMRLSSVLLPEPDGPISATKSPAAMSKLMSVQHRHDLPAAAVGFREIADLRQSAGRLDSFAALHPTYAEVSYNCLLGGLGAPVERVLKRSLGGSRLSTWLTAKRLRRREACRTA